MKYFVIAGEASGDLHASNLMAALKRRDEEADFCFLGGDLMQAQGGRMIRHYKEMAFMGFVPVLMNLRTILRNAKDCKSAIEEYKPDVLILVDYPSFNLQMAKFVKEKLPNVPVFYYISPKLWAWKEYRLKSIKKYVDRVYSILPFEVDWFAQRAYEVDYVGNPCVDAVSNRPHKDESKEDFLLRNQLEDKPILALLSGSRVQEIRKSLPIMLKAGEKHSDYQMVIAGAPSIDSSLYDELIQGYNARVVYGETYELLQQSHMAVVTSGTATLETALLRVPQVVVYMLSGGKWVHQFLRLFINADMISLVNLIPQKHLVKELVMEDFTVEKVSQELERLQTPACREQMLNDYDDLIELLGNEPVSEKASRMMLDRLKSMRGL